MAGSQLASLSFWIALAAVAVGLAWPMTIRFVADVDVGAGNFCGSVSSFWGRAVFRADRGDGRWTVSVRLRLLPGLEVGPVLGTGRRAGKAPAGGPGTAGVLGVADDPVELWRRGWRRWRPALRSLWKGGAFLVRGVALGPWRLRGRIGLGDAARTAVVWGVAWAAFGAAGPLWAGRKPPASAPVVQLRPVYNRWLLQLETSGTVRVRPGRLIGAGCIALAEYVRQRRRYETKTFRANV